jgi:hypothetical protein
MFQKTFVLFVGEALCFLWRNTLQRRRFMLYDVNSIGSRTSPLR